MFADSHGWERPRWFEANAGLVAELPVAWRPPEREPVGGEVPLPDRGRRGVEDPHRGRDVRHDAADPHRGRRAGRGRVPRPADHRDDGQVGRVGDLHARPRRRRRRTQRPHRRAPRRGALPGRRERHARRRPPAPRGGASPGVGRGSVTVRDVTGGTCCIGVWGPLARDLVAPLTPGRLLPRGAALLPLPPGGDRRHPGRRDAGLLRRRARLGDLHRARSTASGSGTCCGSPGGRSG